VKHPAIDVRPLGDVPHLLPVCTRWNYDEWGRDDGETLETISDAFACMVRDARGEHVLIAFVDGEPAGMALLIDNDLDSHAHLKPWVAGVYVAPAFRGKGVATALVAAAEECARRDGHAEAWLYTDFPDLYARMGWITRKILTGERAGMALMAKVL
jgi:GNAT superfamily N-acetyltransferase